MSKCSGSSSSETANTGTTETAPAVDTSGCSQQFATLMQSCQSEVSSTGNSCNSKNDSEMKSIEDGASQAVLMLGDYTASSVQAACSKMAGLSQAANAALGAFKTNCNSAIGSCKSSCSAAKSYVEKNSLCLAGGSVNAANEASVKASMLSAIDDEIKKCNNYVENVDSAQQAINNYAKTLSNTSQCAALTAGDLMSQICAANPTAAGCSGVATADCSNATTAATNKVCCSIYPNNAICVSAQNVTSTVGTGSPSDFSGRLGSSSSTEDLAGDLPALPGLQQGKLNSSGEGQSVDGRQGSGNPLGGGGGAGGTNPAAPKGGGESASGGVAVTGGFYGGGGARFLGNSNAGGGTGSGGGAGGGGTTATAGSSGVDLRQFLPGGQYAPQRGLAGTTGQDGITGPHSNIWQKIQNRYRVMAPSLLP
ncbi:MAG: hypothetical protein AAGB31_11200 [Bdellovibrio sp.]